MALPVTNEVILAELKISKDILESWIKRIEEGIPGEDVPSTPDRLADFMLSLCGELRIVSGTCENLSNVLAGES